MIKIGIIGANDRGKMHLGALKKITEFEIVGIFDNDQNKVNQLAKEFNIKPFNSADKLIERIDAVDVASTNRNYFPEIIKSLKNNKFVSIESTKKFSHSEVEALIKLSHEAGIPVHINNSDRYCKAYKDIDSHLTNPMIIVANRYLRYVPIETGHDHITELLTTDIDIIIKTVKSNIRKIGATGLAVFDENPDLINARLEFDNGSVANLTAGRISQENAHSIFFFQQNAVIELDLTSQQSKISRKGTKKICFGLPNIQTSEIIVDKLVAFLNSIVAGQSPVCTIEDEHNALMIAEKILDKMKLTTNQI